VAIPDFAPGTHGSPGHQYFLQVGSRVGVALSAGMVDLLLQAPTLAWQAHRPLDTGEIVTLRVSLRPGGV
jgi:hypothetical protein